jgi:hypothetical protein
VLEEFFSIVCTLCSDSEPDLFDLSRRKGYKKIKNIREGAINLMNDLLGRSGFDDNIMTFFPCILRVAAWI